MKLPEPAIPASYSAWQMQHYAMQCVEDNDKPAQPDCRTCSNYAHDDDHPQCKLWDACTNGDKYQPAPKVVLWRTEL